MAQQPNPQAQIHEIHTDASGRLAWAEGHGLYRLPQPLAPGARLGALPEQGGTPVAYATPVGIAVLRCTCGDGASHAAQGQHCPQAEIDFAETMLHMLDDNA